MKSLLRLIDIWISFWLSSEESMTGERSGRRLILSKFSRTRLGATDGGSLTAGFVSYVLPVIWLRHGGCRGSVAL